MAGVRVLRCASVDEFLARARPFLVAREAEHNLILGLCSRLAVDPQTYGEPPYLAVALSVDDVVGAALRTPPFGPVLSAQDDPAAVDALVADLYELYGELPGALGPKDVVGRFVAEWRARAGVGARLARAERIYRAQEVSAPAGVPGRMRRYTEADHELATGWLEAFVAEATGDAPHEPPERMLERRLVEEAAGVVLWHDAGEAVSLAAHGGPTPNGIRIGPVYTPPEHRRRGYASALVAAITQELLESGRRFCFLFTDLANPTSNSIYQQVGYRPVADVDQWLFD